MIDLLLSALGLQGVVRDLVRTIIVGVLCATAYYFVADYHYDRGYRACSEEIAEQTREVNAELISVGEADARMRSAAQKAREDAIRETQETFERERQSTSAQSSEPTHSAPDRPQPGCGCAGIPAEARLKLNKVK